MYGQISELIDKPIEMDAFYLEMRLSNDPNFGKHAEDYNLMVNMMVKNSGALRAAHSATTPSHIEP